MNKHEFLAELRKRLSDLPPETVRSTLDYYSEIVDDRMEEGMTEEAAVEAVGTLDEVASEILDATSSAKTGKAHVKPHRKTAPWVIVLLILGSPVWIALLAAAFVIVLATYIVIWSVTIALWATELCLAAGSVAGIVASPFIMLHGNHSWSGMACLGAGLILAGLSIFMFYGCLNATKGMCFVSKRIFLLIKSCFVRKEAKA